MTAWARPRPPPFPQALGPPLLGQLLLRGPWALCPEQGEDDDENARPLAESLLLAIADLLFCPDFTVQSHRRSTVVRAGWAGSGSGLGLSEVLGQDVSGTGLHGPREGWRLAQLEWSHLVLGHAPCIREAGHRLLLSLPGRWVGCGAWAQEAWPFHSPWAHGLDLECFLPPIPAHHQTHPIPFPSLPISLSASHTGLSE